MLTLTLLCSAALARTAAAEPTTAMVDAGWILQALAQPAPMQITQEVRRAGNGVAQARHPFIDGGEDFLLDGARCGGAGGGKDIGGQLVHAAALAGGELRLGDRAAMAGGHGPFGLFPCRLAVHQRPVQIEDRRLKPGQADWLLGGHLRPFVVPEGVQ